MGAGGAPAPLLALRQHGQHALVLPPGSHGAEAYAQLAHQLRHAVAEQPALVGVVEHRQQQQRVGVVHRQVHLQFQTG